MHQFGVGSYYTAEEIAVTVGGDAHSTFPMVMGSTVAMRLRPDVHRDAPAVVHLDAGPVPAHGIETAASRAQGIAVFMRDPRRTLYAYLGEFIVMRVDRDHDRCQAESERIGRRIVGLAHLRTAG